MDNQNALTRIELCSPAKLNLFLHINRRRGPEEDFPGYHELQTVFQILDYGDTLAFQRTESGNINVAPPIQGVNKQDNLIYIAASKLKQLAYEKGLDTSRLGTDITLIKRLPMGGGLGGGSSNAATTLLALNRLWGLDFNQDELLALAASIGADVPLFIGGQTAHADGIGEKLRKIELPEIWYVILHPACEISTSQIFSHERLTRDTPKKRIAPALEGDTQKLFDELFTNAYRNDFEKLVCDLYHPVGSCIKWLSNYGPARMTGTGACCFCPVDGKETAQKVLNEARSKFKGFIAKGVQLSPAIQRLNEA